LHTNSSPTCWLTWLLCPAPRLGVSGCCLCAWQLGGSEVPLEIMGLVPYSALKTLTELERSISPPWALVFRLWSLFVPPWCCKHLGKGSGEATARAWVYVSIASLPPHAQPRCTHLEPPPAPPQPSGPRWGRSHIVPGDRRLQENGSRRGWGSAGSRQRWIPKGWRIH